MTIQTLLRSARILGAAVAAIALSGCATVYLVDNQVQSFPRWADQAAEASRVSRSIASEW